MAGRITAIAAAASLLALHGCFSFTTQQDAKLWTIECQGSALLAGAPRLNEKTPPKTVRLGSVTVAAPWDCDNIVVRRADGSVARDPYNKFASQPASLLKGPLVTLALQDGNFGRVMSSTTAASPDAILELNVSELALDCSGSSRKATVVLSVALISGPGRKVVAEGFGDARIDASAGDYSAAFSEAFSTAVRTAFSQMK